MANNRLWLVHRPTKLAIRLGKRMGWGWYDPPEEDRFQRYFDAVADGNQDDFKLVIERADEDVELSDKWQYGQKDPETGFYTIELEDDNAMDQR